MSDKEILILEDDVYFSREIAQILEMEGFRAVRTASVKQFYAKFKVLQPEIIILDIIIAGEEVTGLDILEEIKKEEGSNTKIIVISGDDSRETINKALKLGAFSYIQKSSEFDIDRFILDIEQAFKMKAQEDNNRSLEIENKRLRKQFVHEMPLIGESFAMQKLKKQIYKFGRTDVNILISGETGTGKEIVAKHLHTYSDRISGHYEVINCSALNENIIESELFGHKKGAFTNAHQDKVGYFEKCSDGILVMDEFHHLSLGAQAKILRVIEYKEIQILGGAPKKVNTRIIFVSNENLKMLMQKKLIREDLYYRIEGNTVEIPPLRDRENDIAKLCEFYLHKYAKEYNKIIRVAIQDIAGELLTYKWPGNVRELKNFCQYVAINQIAISNHVVLKSFYMKKNNDPNESYIGTLDNLLKIGNMNRAVAAFEKEYLEFQLSKNGFKVSATARALGVERSTLYKKIKKLRINTTKSK